MAKKFTIPFATQGDSATIPNELQTDGRVSYVQGFGHDYERDYDDPLAKDIGRSDMNGLFKDITEAVGEIQRLGAAEWSKDFVYPQGATVYHNGEMYVSDINENKNEPPNNWTSLKNISQGSLKAENNLSDVESAEVSRQNLGLGNAATLNKTDVLGTSSNLLATQQLVNNINANLQNAINNKLSKSDATKLGDLQYREPKITLNFNDSTSGGWLSNNAAFWLYRMLHDNMPGRNIVICGFKETHFGTRGGLGIYYRPIIRD